MAKRPHAETRLAKFINKRVMKLRPGKSQAQIAQEAGFINPTMIAMQKNGATKLPLDCDPRMLFNLAPGQSGAETTARAIEEIFGTIATRNEVVWIQTIRDASGNSDPSLTTRSRSTIRGIFGK